MTWDYAIIESGGNGGDYQLVGNDLAVIYGPENQFFLALFGGNIEQSSTSNITEPDSKDWWGNKSLMPGQESLWFNSATERALNETAVTSSGRLVIENAAKQDLDYFSKFGTVNVRVEIVSDDRLNMKISATLENSKEVVVIIRLKKKATGDWSIMDFSLEDFYFG